MAETSTDPITAAIESSMADAGLSETSEQTNDASLETIEGADDDAGAVADDTAGATVVASPSAGADDLGDPLLPAAEKMPVETAEQKADREDLEALGIRPLKPGEKENRLPHSRVSKMVLKGVQRGREQAKTLIATKDAEITRLSGAATEHARISVLADHNAEGFLEAMAVANPRVWKPILQKLQGTAPAAPAVVPASSKTMPAPNLKLADGSMTYDEKGLADLLAWTRAEAETSAVAKAQALIDERFAPLDEERKTAAWQAQQAPKIAAQIKEARETWGPLFEADYQKAEKGEQSEILAYIDANTRVVTYPNGKQGKVGPSFERACQAVLLPKLKAERTKMRGEIIAEINGRKAATTETRQPAKEAPGPRSIEDVIRDSMDEAGLR